MYRFRVCFLLVLATTILCAQERTLPADFRQHGLTQFNASLLNATYGMDWNNPNSVSIWTRWQWQTVDGDPTSLFANYTHGIDQQSSFGIGFLQHNTGTYLYTGANLNYAYAIPIDNSMKLIVGVNTFAFQEKLADDRFISNPDIDLPQLESTNDFILQFSPAIRLQVDQFSVGLAVENAIDFNLSDSGNDDSRNSGIFIGTLSNDFPVTLFSGLEHSFVRPILYVKAIPDADTQFGINGLLSTSKFWLQGGYNSFYGISGGAGVTFAKQFSIGGLLEFGTDSVLSDEKSTVELIASYHFGRTDQRRKVVGFDVEKDDALALERIKAEEEQKRREAQKAQEAEKKAIEQQKRLEEAKQFDVEKEELHKKQAQERDSMGKAILIDKELIDAQRKKDSIAELQREKVELRPNERYEEVTNAEGMEPGFYLIANVFGTKRYFESFMLTLKKMGLNPKSFYRSQNKFNYVYLERYNTMREAREARDSRLDGKYPGKTWVFRVRAN
ncbi:PorP/SprF family type IX secretion system membrane protein [Flagellimonas pacifica]|uniref:Type IX secretion system membrane protein, PorP/SprF family n=1 Tax=Flagellimonas pacifica TaxID=1247520 RepID=A0A285MU13_9FLAO|nr:PorP/SprF family type IX secretion system membrane protein [Allomuricauda parva]SNZ00690.1 type IX secretion system membrane protein, PorP/SprF family [Allomuricauda parva]